MGRSLGHSDAGANTGLEYLSVQLLGDLFPSNILLSAAELEFNRPGREFLLRNCLAEVEEDYDYVISDLLP